MRVRVWSWVATAALLHAAAALAVEAKKTDVQAFHLAPGSRLSLRLEDGSVRLSTWEKEQAEVQIVRRAWASSRREAQRRLDEIEVEVRKRTGEVEIVVFDHGATPVRSFWDLFNPNKWGSASNVSVELQLQVPEGVDLRLEADDADVEAEGKWGAVLITVADGDVELQDLRAARLRLETDDGNIVLYRLAMPEGAIRAITNDGLIRLEECVASEVSAETDDADVAVLRCDLQRLDVRTASGDVEVEPVLQRLSRLRVDTEDGDIILSLPPDPDAELDLRTVTGRIRTEKGVPSEEEGGQRLKVRLGKGRALISAFTEDGDIIVEKR
ncbi:MAG: DUF4097 domain-containing protein [candidate division KSB1 bacterium]|nr:DUF4097 domain-containing protein [candidate division KSB1 bacterium]